jgi:hypothetical protein
VGGVGVGVGVVRKEKKKEKKKKAMLDLVFLLWFVSKAFLRGAILEIFSGRLWETTEAFEINGDADEGVSAGEVTVTGDLDMLTAGWAIGDAGGEGGELALPLMSIDIETTDFAYKKEQVALALGFSERCSIGTMKLGTVALPGSGGVPLVLVLWAAPANADALPDMSKFAADLKKDVEKVLSRSGEEEEEEEGEVGAGATGLNTVNPTLLQTWREASQRSALGRGPATEISRVLATAVTALLPRNVKAGFYCTSFGQKALLTRSVSVDGDSLVQAATALRGDLAAHLPDIVREIKTSGAARVLFDVALSVLPKKAGVLQLQRQNVAGQGLPGPQVEVFEAAISGMEGFRKRLHGGPHGGVASVKAYMPFLIGVSGGRHRTPHGGTLAGLNYAELDPISIAEALRTIPNVADAAPYDVSRRVEFTAVVSQSTAVASALDEFLQPGSALWNSALLPFLPISKNTVEVSAEAVLLVMAEVRAVFIGFSFCAMVRMQGFVDAGQVVNAGLALTAPLLLLLACGGDLRTTRCSWGVPYHDPRRRVARMLFGREIGSVSLFTLSGNQFFRAIFGSKEAAAALSGIGEAFMAGAWTDTLLSRALSRPIEAAFSRNAAVEAPIALRDSILQAVIIMIDQKTNPGGSLVFKYVMQAPDRHGLVQELTRALGALLLVFSYGAAAELAGLGELHYHTGDDNPAARPSLFIVPGKMTADLRAPTGSRGDRRASLMRSLYQWAFSVDSAGSFPGVQLAVVEEVSLVNQVLVLLSWLSTSSTAGVQQTAPGNRTQRKALNAHAERLRPFILHGLRHLEVLVGGDADLFTVAATLLLTIKKVPPVLAGPRYPFSFEGDSLHVVGNAGYAVPTGVADLVDALSVIERKVYEEAPTSVEGEPGLQLSAVVDSFGGAPRIVFVLFKLALTAATSATLGKATAIKAHLALTFQET